MGGGIPIWRSSVEIICSLKICFCPLFLCKMHRDMTSPFADVSPSWDLLSDLDACIPLFTLFFCIDLYAIQGGPKSEATTFEGSHFLLMSLKWLNQFTLFMADINAVFFCTHLFIKFIIHVRKIKSTAAVYQKTGRHRLPTVCLNYNKTNIAVVGDLISSEALRIMESLESVRHQLIVDVVSNALCSMFIQSI